MKTASSRRVFWILLWIAATPLFVVIALLAMPLVLVLRGYEYIVLRILCGRQRTWRYLVCSPRRGWREFVENNLAPALPERTPVVWTTDLDAQRGPLNGLFAAGVGQAKPCLVRVRWFGIQVRSVHNRLQAYKSHSAVDDALRLELAEVLREEMEYLHRGQMTRPGGK